MMRPLPAGKLRTFCRIACVLLASGVYDAPAWALPAAHPNPEAQQYSGVESSLPVFELHSGFWTNLHHFLYLQARLKENSALLDTGHGAARLQAILTVSLTRPFERRNCCVAIGSRVFTKDLAGRDLLLNMDMENINNRLSGIKSRPPPTSQALACRRANPGLKPELIEALDRAAPVYRAHWWPAHDRANREWITRVAPMVRQMGVQLSGQLAEVYQRPWPQGEAPSGRGLVRRALRGLHFPQSDPRNNFQPRHARDQDIYGFEVLFHESSHALAGSVTEAISREFRLRDKPIPRDLWHALLSTTGRAGSPGPCRGEHDARLIGSSRSFRLSTVCHAIWTVLGRMGAVSGISGFVLETVPRRKSIVRFGDYAPHRRV